MSMTIFFYFCTPLLRTVHTIIFYKDNKNITLIALPSSYIGGSGEDYKTDIISDPDGTMWVFGTTISTDFPFTDGYQHVAGASDSPFMMHVSSGGSVLSTIHSRNVYNGNSIALSPDGTFWSYRATAPNVYTPVPLDYIVNFDRNGNIITSVNIPGLSQNQAFSGHTNILPDGSFWLAGSSSQPFFISTDGTVFSGTRSAWMAHFASDGQVLYGSYLAGSSVPSPLLNFNLISNSFAFPADGTVWMAGVASTAGLPTTDGSTYSVQPQKLNMYITHINPATGEQLYGTYIKYDAGVFGSIWPSYMTANPDGSVSISATNSPVINGVASFPVTSKTGFDQFINFTLKPCPTGYYTANDILSPPTQEVCIGGILNSIVGQQIVVPGDSLPLLYAPNATTQTEIQARYQWQISNTSIGPWISILDATTKDYLPIINYATRHYRRLALSPTCCGSDTLSITQAVVLVTTNTVPKPNYAPFVTTCSGTNITLTGSLSGGLPPYTYLWDKGAGITANPVVSPTLNTIYTLTFIDANGCKQIAQTLVNAYSVDPGLTKVLCQGLSTGVPIGGLPIPGLGVTYAWTPTTALSCTTCIQPIAAPATSTSYTLTGTLTNSDGILCSTSNSVMVDVVKAPTGSLAASDITSCTPTLLSLGKPQQVGFTYLWANTLIDPPYSISSDATLSSSTVSNPDLTLSNDYGFAQTRHRVFVVSARKNTCVYKDTINVYSLRPKAGLDGCGPRSIGENVNHPAGMNETYQWTKLSGTGNILGSTTNSQTTVDGGTPGLPTSYQLSVSYAGVTCYDTVVVDNCSTLFQPVLPACASYNSKPL